MKSATIVLALFMAVAAFARDEKPPTTAKCPEMEKHWQANFDRCVSTYTAKNGENHSDIAKEGCKCISDWIVRGRSCQESVKASVDENAEYGLEKCKTTLETLNRRVKIK